MNYETVLRDLKVTVYILEHGFLQRGLLTLSGPAFSVVRQARGGLRGPDAKNQG